MEGKHDVVIALRLYGNRANPRCRSTNKGACRTDLIPSVRNLGTSGLTPNSPLSSVSKGNWGNLELPRFMFWSSVDPVCLNLARPRKGNELLTGGSGRS